MLDMAPSAQLTAVLSRLDKALASGDIEAALALFQDDCYWRDLVTFTWNIRTMEGKDADSRHADQRSSQASSPRAGRWPRARTRAEDDGVVSGWITFETGVARGFGHIRLKDGTIWTLLTTMAELKGHEEPLGFDAPDGRQARRRQAPPDLEGGARGGSRRRSATRRSPMCVIIGGGQGGIAPRRAAAPARRADHHRREERAARRQLAQALQVALPARSGLVRPPALYAVPGELAGVLAQGQDRRLAGDVHQGHGAELLGAPPTCKRRR